MISLIHSAVKAHERVCASRKSSDKQSSSCYAKSGKERLYGDEAPT